MNEPVDVQRYFHEQAAQFDRIYEGKGPLLRWLDKKFRSSIFIRYALTFEFAGDVTGQRVLDIGCGSGRYCVEFARRGASEVVGVDLADNMIALANQEAARCQVTDRCRFVVGDFADQAFDRPFDIVIAMGVFDYLHKPEDFLRRMIKICSRRWMASFPKWDLIRAPLRRWRYRFRRCPVYYYTRERVRQLMASCGLTDYGIKDIPGRGQDWFVWADMGDRFVTGANPVSEPVPHGFGI